VEANRAKRVQSVLFVCAMNAVRSPMAEAIAKHYFGKSIYVQSAGVRKGEANGFVPAILDEIGIDASKHKPQTLKELEEWEGLNFDLIISLSPEAHHAALELTRTVAADVEYWPTPDPTLVHGSREQVLDAYRNVRDGLLYRIRLRLKQGSEAKGPEQGERA
jgi:protein-tyrosine-phosphatase